MELLFVILSIFCKNSDMLSTNNASDMHQQTGIRTAKVGETVTLSCSFPLLLVYCLSAALALSIIGVLVLTSFMYKLSLKLKSVCEGVDANERPPSTRAAVQEREPGSFHYSAVNLRRSTEQRLRGDTEEACVYSRVKRPKE
ncbi:PREDICTED: uncharacterized protein LOC106917178 isoform X2 [Poecilia mexicana]|uniref:uncharacterized protein LOC106917178 isoform X2 n=1 Tax=Poecilia mexicana TaxID=48701 RepID=UPI00072E55CB|nr:PREDICTED: uncharacterized protein LOC106917178 isoform X2 [Poecilia mexicana]